MPQESTPPSLKSSITPPPPSPPVGASGRRTPKIAVILTVCALAAAAWLAHRASRPAQSATAAPVQTSAPSVTQGPPLEIFVTADGQPQPDVDVVLVGAKCQQRSATDERGSVLFDHCPAGAITATIEARGFVRERRFIQLKDHGSSERVDLQPSALLSGQVLDDEDSALHAVTLVARALGASNAGYTLPPWTVLSADDGSFAFETLPEGHFTLEAHDGGDHEAVTLADVELPNESLLIALRRTAAISGTVSDASTAPVARASVTLAGSGVWPARIVQTAASGEFTFAALPEGVYEIRAQRDADVSAPIEGIHLRAGTRAQFDIALAKGAELMGSVRAAVTGRALSGVVLEVVEETLSGSAQRMQTGADGSFQLSGLRNIPHRVTIRHPGYVTQQRWLKPGTPVAIELLRAAAISGKVEDADGHPVSHAELEVAGHSITGAVIHMLGPVQEVPALDSTVAAQTTTDNLGVTGGAVPRVPVVDLAGDRGAEPLAGVGFQSDAEGNFHVEGLPPGQVTITARKPRLGVGRSAQLTLRAGATLDDVTIALPRGYRIKGRVLDAHAAPVAHLRVDLDSPGDPPRSITSEADGTFIFEAARGECTLWARPLGAPAIKVSGLAHVLTQAEVVLKLEGGSDRLSGRVFDAHGQPLDAVTVRLEVVHSHGYAPVLLTEPDGVFEFSALPPPPYALYVDHPEHQPIRALPVDHTRDPVVIRMESGTRLSGVVRDGERNTPLVAAEVSFRSATLTRTVRSGRDGRFELTHVPQGAYELMVNAERFLPEQRTGLLESAPGAAVPLSIALTPAASVSGDVVDALGRTVWNAQVAAGTPPDWDHATRTDHAGHFQLRGLSPGEHVLHARYGDNEAVSTQPERTVAGEDSRGAVLRLLRAVDETALQVADAAHETAESPVRAQALSFARRSAGIVVERVAPGSAAARAGLQIGDVLLSVNGEPVRSAAQARGMLAPLLGQSAVQLEVRRDGDVQRLRYATSR